MVFLGICCNIFVTWLLFGADGSIFVYFYNAAKNEDPDGAGCRSGEGRGGSRFGDAEIPRFTRNDDGGGEAHKIFGCRDSSAMRMPRNDGVFCAE